MSIGAVIHELNELEKKAYQQALSEGKSYKEAQAIADAERSQAGKTLLSMMSRSFPCTLKSARTHTSARSG